MTAAILSLVGTLLGAVTALIGSALADRRHARREDERWYREHRGTAYAEATRYLLRANRASGENDSEIHRMQDGPDWRNDLLDAQYWLRILTFRCKPEQQDRLNLLALRLDEAIGTLSSEFKQAYLVLIIQTCLEGVIECARADAGVGATPGTAPPPAPLSQDRPEGYLP